MSSSTSSHDQVVESNDGHPSSQQEVASGLDPLQNNNTHDEQKPSLSFSSSSACSQCMKMVKIPDAFYSMNYGKRFPEYVARLKAPASQARWLHVIAFLSGLAVFVALLVNNVNTPQETISALPKEGWTCKQIIPLSRSPSEVVETDFCGYSNTVKPEILIAPYSVFKGKAESDVFYTSQLNCLDSIKTVPSSSKVYSFRDSYFYNGQQYDSYEQCLGTLRAMCNSHSTSTFKTAITTSPVPVSPYVQPGNIFSNAYDVTSQTVSVNRNWFAFNATNCASACGTTGNSFTFPASSSYQISMIGSVQKWQSIAMSSDGTVIVGVVTDSFLYVSTDAGLSFNPRISVQKWSCVAISANGKVIVALASLVNIYMSYDAGQTWTTTSIADKWQVAAMSLNGQIILVGTNDGFDGYLYVSMDSGVTFNQVGPNQTWQAVSMSGDGKVMAAICFQCPIYLSFDYGATWKTSGPSLLWFSISVSKDASSIYVIVYQGMLYKSLDSGITWSSSGKYDKWWAVTTSYDGQKVGLIAYMFNAYISTNSGSSWIAVGAGLFWSCIAMNHDGSILAIGIDGGAIFLVQTVSTAQSPYNLPAVSYDEAVSIGSSGTFLQTCPSESKSTNIVMNAISYQFCDVPSTTSAALINHPEWQLAQPSVNKAPSAGQWQFGSWGFCLDNVKYQTCDAQFKGDICNSGFFEAMLGDKLCGKYKTNTPYACTTSPNYLSLVALAVTAASAVLGAITSIFAFVMGLYFGNEFDGDDKAMKKQLSKLNKSKGLSVAHRSLKMKEICDDLTTQVSSETAQDVSSLELQVHHAENG
jgi:hypothetical protein